MALVVEDGSGVYNANAFITLQFFRDYCDERGMDHSTFTDDKINAAIVRATMYLSESFRYKGQRTKIRNYEDPTRTQALEWPRVGVVDDRDVDADYGEFDGYRTGYGYGVLIPNDVIPRELKWATAEVAFYELQNQGAFTPAHRGQQVVKSEKVGPLSVTYETGQNVAANARPVLPYVLDLIGPFLAVGYHAATGMAVRM